MHGETERLLAAAREWRAPKALATVIKTWGSAPRPVGSHMLVTEDGDFEGSVSGGCVEGQILHIAGEVIASDSARLLEFGVSDDSAWEVGLPCGGQIAVFLQPVTANGFAPELFEAISQARNAGSTLHLTTDLASGRTWIGAEAGPDRFLSSYAPPRRLLIIGAGAIAQALVGLASLLDTRVTVIDPRERFLTEVRFPAVELDDRWPDEAIVAHRPDATTAIVTLSHDPKIDDAALTAALASPAGYIAALGSRRSHAARVERLTAAGLPAEAIQRIDAPAGIPIGAIGPAEIALSIAAAMVKALRQALPADAA